jgi:hypothetical protein
VSKSIRFVAAPGEQRVHRLLDDIGSVGIEIVQRLGDSLGELLEFECEFADLDGVVADALELAGARVVVETLLPGNTESLGSPGRAKRRPEDPRDDEVDRLFAFVSRGFHRGLEDVHEINRLGTDRAAAFRDYRIARQLERVVDHAERIATVAVAQSGPPADGIGDSIETVGADARRPLELALAEESERASDAIGDALEAIEELDRRLYEGDDPDAYRYGTVLESLWRTVAIAGNVLEVTSETRIDA